MEDMDPLLIGSDTDDDEDDDKEEVTEDEDGVGNSDEFRARQSGRMK